VNEELTRSGTEILLDALIDSRHLKVFLQRLIDMAIAETGQDASDVHCSVTMSRNRRPLTVVSSDPQAAAMDEVQYASKQGPCLEALRTGQLVEVLDLRAESRWPRYIAAMAGKPLRSVLAIPIPLLPTTAAAALNCYSPYRGPVARPVKEALLDFTSTAARALVLAVEIQRQKEQAADLAAALESRTAIDLATGVIMAQTGCDQKHAVEIMIKASANRNEKLRDVALGVLERFNGGSPTTHFDTA